MSDRLTRADIEALVAEPERGVSLCAEFRAELRCYEHFRRHRKKAAGSRPPNTYGEECDGTQS